MKAKIIAAFNETFVAGPAVRRISLTELDRDMSYTGTVESIRETNGKIEVSLLNVEVFEYSSSMPLYNVSKIKISRPEEAIFLEELTENNTGNQRKIS
ncbi:hypothetical protein [Mucilaginibacter sp. UYCu711]|uniref:hypothetical protein n=1 Tax=Mucilaginibacter sp. UYCu711 TaxID=3156339 RepID=UPI003D1B16D1